MGDADLAAQQMRRAIELVPTRGRGHYLLATILLDQERHDDALASIDTALRYGVQTPAEALNTAGMIEVMQARWPQAVERFEQAVKVDASFTMGYVSLALSLGETNGSMMRKCPWTGAAAGHPCRRSASARMHLAEMETAAGIRR